MQKRKIIIVALLTFVGGANVVRAEGTASSQASADKQAPAVVVDNPDPTQQHVIELIEQDFSFEAQRRALRNELDLAKMRSDIHKLNETFDKISPPSIPDPVQAMAQSGSEQSIAGNSKPRIVLVSQIAGISRIAVESGSGVKLVSVNEHFSVDGRTYSLLMGKDNVPTLRELTQ